MIDEIHERNADVDLLCSLAKQAVKVRKNHPTLPPLQLVLMSATVESSSWERYFEKEGFSVATVQVPDVRRFPIDMVHLDDANFPRGAGHCAVLLRWRRRNGKGWKTLMTLCARELLSWYCICSVPTKHSRKVPLFSVFFRVWMRLKLLIHTCANSMMENERVLL